MEKKELFIEKIDFVGVQTNPQTNEKIPVPLSILYNTNVISRDEIFKILEKGDRVFQDARFIVTSTVQACAVLDIPVPNELKPKEQSPDVVIGNEGAEFVQ